VHLRVEFCAQNALKLTYAYMHSTHNTISSKCARTSWEWR